MKVFVTNGEPDFIHELKGNQVKHYEIGDSITIEGVKHTVTHKTVNTVNGQEQVSLEIEPV